MKFPQLYDSPLQKTPASSEFGADLDTSPYLDYELDLDADGNYDLDVDDQMIGSLPGAPTSDGEGGASEKRKLPEGENEDDEGGGKRREGEDKTAKKPGRKPLTSEPTSKRKAQNRAAQRAFRERKEKHLRDLETKVADLEKASESANHENSLLRSQVDRLQTELREYRKRLHTNSSSNSRTTSTNGTGLPAYLANNLGNNNNFSFDFPRFGASTVSPFGSNGLFSGKAATMPVMKTPGVLERPTVQKSQSTGGAGSMGKTSPNGRLKSNGTNVATPLSNGVEGLADLFSPSILSAANKNSPFDFISQSQVDATHTQQFSNPSISTSPSASSVSHHGPDSSCGTTPEPTSNNSPTKSGENLLNTISEEYTCSSLPGDEVSFCEKLNMACGNPNNPVPRARSESQSQDTPSSTLKTPPADVNGIDWLSQSGSQLDPLIFGEYRETQDAGEFGGFFDDAFPLPDLGDYNNEQQKRNALPELDDKFDDDDEVVPGEDPSSLLSCNKIWERLQTMPGITNGQVDLEDLCSELRRKARCSETGVVVNEKDFNSIVSGLPHKAH
ncbi:MAG: DNA-binding transcription factor yap1 [Geoglossum simile]|nr:MAG: DNA-binding transcription factor yap1 [Geoglossum simile]